MIDAGVPAPTFTGAKLPLKPVHVWGIRVRLQVDSRIRDLALFDLAIDSKLRGCDLVTLQMSFGSVEEAEREARSKEAFSDAIAERLT